MHEELCGADLQVRVSDVHEILQEMTATLAHAGPTLMLLAVATVGPICLGADRAAGAEARKLSGSQIKTRFAGMQLTDEVHYRFVCERDGTLRSYSMGTRKVGKWSIEKDELCFWLGDKDDGCYAVTPRGGRFELVPSGLGVAFDGIVEPASRN
jgi:hypothetical protein